MTAAAYLVDFMAEPGRTQLQMMLVQQAGQGALPLSILPKETFLPFLRDAEQMAVSNHLMPIVVYWSRHNAAPILPGGQRYRTLTNECYRVSIFSEDRLDPPDEWCFLLQSPKLCVVVYGQQATEAVETGKYQCTGSMDPQIVHQAFHRLLPVWQFVNLTESDRLEDARASLGPCISDPQYVQLLRAAWPIIKAPIQQSLILDTDMREWDIGDDDFTPSDSSDLNKINPIAVDLRPPANNPQPTGSHKPPPLPSQLSAAQSSPEFAELDGPARELLAMAQAMQAQQSAQGAQTSQGSQGSQAQVRAQTQPLNPPSQQTQAKPSASPLPDAKPFGKRSTRIGIKAVTKSEETEETFSTIPSEAQVILGDIIGQLRHSNNLASILQYAIESLAKVLNADRGIIWQIVGDQLAVTHEVAASENKCFVGNELNSQESTAVVLEFLSRFPDESGAGVIAIEDTSKDTHLHKMSPTLSSLLELGGVKARLLVQLRSRGKFSGFLELQQCSAPREWSRHDAAVLQRIAEMLSVVVLQSHDQSVIEMDAQEMKLINEIASLFRESRGQSSQDSLVKSVIRVAEHMGFTHSQIYLSGQLEGLLAPQIQDGKTKPVSIADKENPFVSVFESGRGKIINAEFTRKKDPFFGHDMALVLPLVSEGERLGVVGLWERHPSRPHFRPQDRELGFTITSHLANVIRADQAISQIRADQARAALINKVSSDIRNSLKEVDQTSDTLVGCLQDYFHLELCVVSLFDGQTQDFSRSKSAGPLAKAALEEAAGKGPEEVDLIANLGERLFMACQDDLKRGQTLYLDRLEIIDRLKSKDISDKCSAATLVPLIHAGNFKAALCLAHGEGRGPISEKDMNMVKDLADRVAVTVSHAELFAQVERQAITDAMTGLYNRRYFQEQLIKEIDRFQRFGHPMSFIIVDLDYLKKINDSLGHHFGDIAIKHIANVIKRNVRDVDTVGRFGGEEFTILLPETDLAQARMVSERICAAIREKPVENVGTITASLGLATFPIDADNIEKLFELADQALFLAKHRGRNRVCSVAEDLLPSIGEGNSLPLSGGKTKEMKLDLPTSSQTLPAMPAKPQADKTCFDLDVFAEKGILGIFAMIMKQVEERDAYDAERSPRAYDYASKLATSLHLSREHSEVITLAAIMSNLGKVTVPEEVLQKKGPLNPAEMDMMKQTPAAGAKLLEQGKLLHRVSAIIEAYREHWDGSGYPKGLKQDEIPLEARIIALVDAFTAMTSDRPYRAKLSHEDAIALIQEGSGKLWDPRLVKVFVSLLQRELGRAR